MKQSSTEISDELLAKYVARQTTTAEDEQIEAWKGVNNRNANRLAQFEHIWETSNRLRPAVDKSTNEAWQKLKHRMVAVPATIDIPTRPLRSPINIYYKIAAILLIAVGFGFWAYNYSQFSSVPSISYQTKENTMRQVLPDGSEVFLNRYTTLTLAAGFNHQNRKLYLDGEAYFEVKPDKNNPFEIDAHQTHIKVLGTAFNLKTTDKQVVVNVTHGKVEFSNVSQKVQLTKNQSAISTKDSVIYTVKPNSNDLAYYTGVYIFEGAQLDEVVASLQAGYHADIKLRNTKMLQCRLTARFEKESLANTLSIIAETLHLKVTKQGKTFWLDGEGCQP